MRGSLRSSRCILPEGSIVNPQFPAAVGMRSLGTVRTMSTIFGAFAQALPAAAPGRTGRRRARCSNVRTTDNRTGRRVMANISPITAGAGGSAEERRSPRATGHNQAFFKNTPVEINEAETPIKILEYSLSRDSGGAGRCRGGLATSMTFQGLLSPYRAHRPQPGPGALHALGHSRAARRASPPPSSSTPAPTTRSTSATPTSSPSTRATSMRITAAGGGGYGPPHDAPRRARAHRRAPRLRIRSTARRETTGW